MYCRQQQRYIAAAAGSVRTKKPFPLIFISPSVEFAIPIRASRTAYRLSRPFPDPFATLRPTGCALRVCVVDSLTNTTVRMTKWYISTWNSSDSNALCFFFYKKKKRKCCLQLFVVSCLLFLWLFCHGLLKHLPRLRAQMRWWRDVVYTRRRKTKEVEVKLESSTAQQPTALPAGHVERPPWIPIGNSSRVAGKMLTGRSKKKAPNWKWRRTKKKRSVLLFFAFKCDERTFQAINSS